jgi:hypothetical protein
VALFDMLIAILQREQKQFKRILDGIKAPPGITSSPSWLRTSRRVLWQVTVPTAEAGVLPE